MKNTILFIPILILTLSSCSKFKKNDNFICNENCSPCGQTEFKEINYEKREYTSFFASTRKTFIENGNPVLKEKKIEINDKIFIDKAIDIYDTLSVTNEGRCYNVPAGNDFCDYYICSLVNETCFDSWAYNYGGSYALFDYSNYENNAYSSFPISKVKSDLKYKFWDVIPYFNTLFETGTWVDIPFC